MLRRSAGNKIYPEIWQMITGGIEVDETTPEAIVRELEEETGITNARIYVVPHINTFYLAVIDKVCMCPVFLAMVESKDVRISDEHSEYRWVSFEEAKGLIHWPNQIDSMKIIEENLGDENLFSKLVEIKI